GDQRAAARWLAAIWRPARLHRYPQPVQRAALDLLRAGADALSCRLAQWLAAELAGLVAEWFLHPAGTVALCLRYQRCRLAVRRGLPRAGLQLAGRVVAGLHRDHGVRPQSAPRA